MHLPDGIVANRPLAPLTSWKIGGPAALFAEPSDPAALLEHLEYARARDLPVLALGGGSNLLISDGGFAGLVIRYADAGLVRESATTGDLKVRIGARAPLARTARALAREGWAGLEWAEGIPGTFGGAVVGNAGAFGGQISGAVEEVEILSLDQGRRIVPRDDCGFGYRRSLFRLEEPNRTFVLGARVHLRREDPPRLEARLEEISLLRKSRTPAGLSCGSVFKNPTGEAAGRLIEEVGLKGARQGGAEVSELHANYIINRGVATAEDVRALIELVRSRVLSETGIRLELEVRLIGFDEG